MLLKKNIKVGKVRIILFLLVFLIFFLKSFDLKSSNDLEGDFTDIKVLDKISSKNVLIKLKNGKKKKYKDY